MHLIKIKACLGETWTMISSVSRIVNRWNKKSRLLEESEVVESGRQLRARTDPHLACHERPLSNSGDDKRYARYHMGINMTDRAARNIILTRDLPIWADPNLDESEFQSENEKMDCNNNVCYCIVCADITAMELQLEKLEVPNRDIDQEVRLLKDLIEASSGIVNSITWHPGTATLWSKIKKWEHRLRDIKAFLAAMSEKEASKRQFESKDKELMKATKQLDAKTDENAVLKQHLREANKRLEEKDNLHAEALSLKEDDFKKAEKMIKELKKSLVDMGTLLHANERHWNDKLDEAELKFSKVDTLVEAKHSENKHLSDKIGELKRCLTNAIAESELHRREKNEQLEAKDNEIRRLNDWIEALQHQLDENEALHDDEDAMSQEVHHLKAKINDLEDLRKELKEELDKVKHARDNWLSELLEFRAKGYDESKLVDKALDEANEEKHRLTNRIEELEKELVVKDSEIDLLTQKLEEAEKLLNSKKRSFKHLIFRKKVKLVKREAIEANSGTPK